MGFNTSLDLPDFLIPFGKNITWQSNKPHTLVELNTNYLYRNLTLPEYNGAPLDITLEQLRFGGSFGYTWNHNRNIKHKLLPFNLSYSHLISGEEYYQYLSSITSDIQFLYQAIDYVLLNTHYEYTFSNQKIGTRDNFNYLRFSVETAGNLLNAVDRLIYGSQHATDENDVQYYQYFRFDSEFKRYIHWGKKGTLVLRSLIGFGIPYGHSDFIPFEKMFVGGGPTTMRGWALRHLGYGQFQTSESDFAMGNGDIQIVANIEHRFPIIGIFEGALFADIGNVWMSNDWGIGNPAPFQLSEVLRGVALDAGLGIRANISIVTLRVDLALPFYDPGYPADRRWLPSHWSWDKIVANFGINYPF
jgi:outer membrane protein assembly factor BamA